MQLLIVPYDSSDRFYVCALSPLELFCKCAKDIMILSAFACSEKSEAVDMKIVHMEDTQ